jgi:hypothetical protein
MKFMLEIEIGNDAMQSYDNIANALNDRALALNRMCRGGDMPAVNDCGSIRDTNGNRVGQWGIVE